MKPEKRKCSSEHYADAGRDRLSEMPDEVIVHILSYMPTVDAVRTMLIRPFGNLWTLVHILNFDVNEFLNKMGLDDKWGRYDVRPFCSFVRNALMLHKRPFIDKFYLCLGYEYEGGRREAGDDITMWLKFALDKHAKEIFFCDVSYKFTKSSDFPNFISQSLVTLELWNCSIYPQLQVNLGSLKKLILCEMNMCEEGFSQFICGCPSLQELRIQDPYEIRNLSFSAPNIRKLSLVLMDAEFDDYDDRWLFDFPNLKSLDLATSHIPNVIDVSSVRDFYLENCSYFMDKAELRKFKIFLKKFRGTEVFQLSVHASEPFLHSVRHLHLLQMRWKRVVLVLRVFCQSCLLGFYQLMRSSKHLEELIIHTTTELTLLSSVLLSSQRFQASTGCVMPKLKTITLHGYAKPWKYQLQLVEFLLKSATVLEKMVFVPNKRQLTTKEKLEKLDFVMHVSSLQRSSPKARVLFR
ncbi:F-box/FBD/LRR-repeat protein At4g26340-like [Silene latifolia]|uniref:F-box/FBD/LRR-repeat protein At4g26340-like n=1 Tax=Silene latifolia TaxID=37657 RepID=UPI003D7740D4